MKDLTERQQISQDTVEELYREFKAGAVLDGKTYNQVIDPYGYCVKIVKSWVYTE